MAFINNGTCKNPLAMSWLSEIFWLSVRYNFHLGERHLPGKLNKNSDRISRLLQYPVLSPDGFNDLFSTPQDVFRSWTSEPSLFPPLPMQRVHNRVVRSRHPAYFVPLIPPSRPSLRRNPDPAKILNSFYFHDGNLTYLYSMDRGQVNTFLWSI